jgi:hypothetical protein
VSAVPKKSLTQRAQRKTKQVLGTGYTEDTEKGGEESIFAFSGNPAVGGTEKAKEIRRYANWRDCRRLRKLS